MTEPGPRPHTGAGRGLSASHLVLSANEGGGAGERQAEGHDGEGDQGVEYAVHIDGRHFIVPFGCPAAGVFRSPCPKWTMLR